MIEKRCSACHLIKPLADFYMNKSGRRVGQPTAQCRVCSGARSKRYYHANREKAYAAHRDWVSRNRDCVKRHKIKASFGLSPEAYDAMPQVCVICGSVGNLCVDHSHQTGGVRGLLCAPCNKGLGHFRDDPTLLLRAADYLFGVAKPDIFAATYEAVQR